MSAKPPTIYVLGDGPVARVLSLVLCADQVIHLEDGRGWNWSVAGRKPGKELEAAKLVLVGGMGSGESKWIRWHREARECPLARKVGVLLFGIEEDLAGRLAKRDVFGRAAATDSRFEEWSDDLGILSRAHGLRDLVTALDQLGCLYRSSWERELRAASCLPDLVQAVELRDIDRLRDCLEAAHATDWDAICFDGPEHGAHAWANRARAWLKRVTAGVTPDWEEGLALFAPLCDE